MRKYVAKLKTGCSSGIDGIVSEHIKSASDTDLNFVLCSLITVCFRAGIVPDSFCPGNSNPTVEEAPSRSCHSKKLPSGNIVHHFL